MGSILVFFAVSSGLCWLLVFKRSARNKFQRPGEYIGWQKKTREMPLMQCT